ncbi:mechanosensitive ion channel family protein [Microbacterium murale]|nr:mechanosensitive ion channel domain-containing protein [Microbacterium murale]
MLPFDTTPTPDSANEVSTSFLTILKDIGGRAIAIAIIVVVAFLIGLALRFVVRRVVHRIVDGAKSKANVEDTQALERSPLADMRLIQRTRTLGSILQNIINVAVVVVGLLMVMAVIAPDLIASLTLLTAALGAGLGFGAQNIVKDVLNGLFIVAEDQIGIGDVVDTGLASGVVEHVSVRVTQVRDVNGTLWYVRNGEMLRIGNMSQGWARAIIDLGVPVDADVPEVEAALLEAALGLSKDPKWRTRIIERPEVWGLESISGEALVIRVVLKTRANAKDDVARELRMRLKRAIEELGLTVPSLESVVPTGPEGARRVRGANPPTTKPNAVTGVPPVSRGIWRKKDTRPASKDTRPTPEDEA